MVYHRWLRENKSTFSAYLSHTLRASPVSFGYVLQRWDQAECVVAVVTAITQKEPVLFVPSSTHKAEIKVDLRVSATFLFIFFKAKQNKMQKLLWY